MCYLVSELEYGNVIGFLMHNWVKKYIPFIVATKFQTRWLYCWSKWLTSHPFL